MYRTLKVQMNPSLSLHPPLLSLSLSCAFSSSFFLAVRLAWPSGCGGEAVGLMAGSHLVVTLASKEHREERTEYIKGGVCVFGGVGGGLRNLYIYRRAVAAVAGHDVCIYILSLHHFTIFTVTWMLKFSVVFL